MQYLPDNDAAYCGFTGLEQALRVNEWWWFGQKKGLHKQP
jgi:hypothetical protein